MPLKPLSLLICKDWPEARDLMSIEHWPIRYGKAIRIDKARSTIETKTDIFQLFWSSDTNILCSMEIKEFYISDYAINRPDLIHVIRAVFLRRRIQAIPNYLQLLGQIHESAGT